MIKDFNFWIEYEGASEGSGRSEKIWLVNPDDGKIGLFKFPKSEYTTEHISEKIASEIANRIHLQCMKVDIGIYDSRIGCLSYRINQENQNLIEGIQLINKYYPSYDEETLYDKARNEYYSLEMILTSLQEYSFKYDFFKIPIFDFLIGNTDRHHSNWAILQRDKEYKLCPLYDNGSSLCCYIEESRLDSYLGNDKVRFQSLINSKSKSRIRINKQRKKEPTHFEVLEFLKDNYYANTIDFVKEINKNINKKSIDYILEAYENLINEKRKQLIKKFLLGKIKLMREIFSLREEE